jgi:hypothetical protein
MQSSKANTTNSQKQHKAQIYMNDTKFDDLPINILYYCSFYLN